MDKLLKISTLFICTSLLFACSNEAKEVKGVADIVLRDKQVVLSVNETYQINPSYFVGNKRQSNITFAYQSLNNDVATVSNTGLVTAIAVGEAIIQVTSKDCKTLFKVVVQEDESSALLALNLQDSFVNLYEDDQFEFTLTPTAASATTPLPQKAAASTFITIPNRRSKTASSATTPPKTQAECMPEASSPPTTATS